MNYNYHSTNILRVAHPFQRPEKKRKIEKKGKVRKEKNEILQGKIKMD